MWWFLTSPTLKQDKIKNSLPQNRLLWPPSAPIHHRISLLDGGTPRRWGRTLSSRPLAPFPRVPVQSGICLQNPVETSFVRVTGDITLPHAMVDSQSSTYHWPVTSTDLTGDHSLFLGTVPSHRTSRFSFYFRQFSSSFCFVGSSSSSSPQTGSPQSSVVGSRLFLNYSHVSCGLIHVRSFKCHTCTDNFQSHTSVPDLSFQLQNVCPPRDVSVQLSATGSPTSDSLLSQFHRLSQWHQHSPDFS